MRILHVIESVSPESGGPAEVIRLIARYAPPGYSNELVTMDEPNAPFLGAFACPAYGVGGRGTVHSAALTAWLRKNRSRFDGVLLHALWRFPGVAVRRTIAGHLPYIVFAHGMLDPYFKRASPLKHLKKSAYWLVQEYWLLRGAWRVLFTTETERRLAEQTFRPWRWTPAVVPIGTEGPSRPATELQSIFAGQFPELAGKRFLLFLGRIDPKKGCDLLLEAFARLAVAHPGIDLVMAGPDNKGWKHKLQTMAAELGIGSRVHWPGMLTGDIKWGALAACEAFVLPSHQENFGVAVVEAMAAGRPVLLSTEVNIAADIANAGCGLIEPDTLDGTTQLLQRWFTMPAAERDAMALKAQPAFAQLYDMRRNAGEILRLFEHAGSRAAAQQQAPAAEAR